MSLKPIQETYTVGTITKIHGAASAMPTQITVEYFVEGKAYYITENVKYVTKRDGFFGQKRVPAIGSDIRIGMNVDVMYDSTKPSSAFIKYNK